MLHAKKFEAQTNTSYMPPKEIEVNRLPDGGRDVTKQLPTGKGVYDSIPLTATDLLNPQLGGPSATT